MIWEIKAMITGCIDRMSRDSCGDCARKDPCTALFSRFFTAARPAPEPRRTNGGGLPPFFALLGEVAKAMEARSAPPPPSVFRRRVEAAAEPLLEQGRARIEEVARELGVSRQTLYRRLKEEGTTFEEVLDSLRRRLALRMIRDDKLSVKEAAWRLGFSDPAAFSRAYKRWTGRSPRGPRQPG